MTSHAAVVARGMGKPCVCGCEALSINFETQTLSIGGQSIKAGELMSIDGTAGRVIKGQVIVKDAVLSVECIELLTWADEIKKLDVRANADNPEDAIKSREFGAKGIGLTRTEHMFMGADRLPHVQAMILAEDTAARAAALDVLLPMQESDFYGILKAMDGYPVCIRLLDPPLHEFLPNREELMVEMAIARETGKNAEKLPAWEKLWQNIDNLHEFNPMLGHRGCRLGISWPEIYEMQIRAIFNATARLTKEGFQPHPEVEIPLTIDANEMRFFKERIDRIATEVKQLFGTGFHYTSGTMIEIPRAALMAAEMAEFAEFFSFGTNDLTQTTLGFSRDVLVANSRLNQAEAQTGQARAFMLPSLLINIKAGQETSTPGAQIDTSTGKEVARSVHDRQDTSITLRQPIVDVASLYDWKRRKVIEESRQEGIRTSRGDTYVSTVNAYLALISTRIQANMAIDYENQLNELFQYIDKRAKAGAASNADKERVRARMLSAKSSRVEQEAAQAAAGIELVRLINLAPNSLRIPELEDVGLSIVPKTLDEAMPRSIDANPDIASLRAELDAANLDKNAAKARFLPTLNLEYSDTDSVHAGGQAGSQHDQRLMVVMNWSVLNGGSDWKLKDEKEARYMELSYRLDDQQRKVIQSLSAQYATLEATRERLAGGYKELDSIASAAKSMSARMVSGNQSLLDMLDVYDRYYQARTRLVTLHIQEMTAISQIARLVQGAPNAQVASLENFGNH